MTGARDRLWDGLDAYIQRIRQHTDLPLAIGFGISSPQHVTDAAAIADGVILASELLDRIGFAPESEQIETARTYLTAMKRATYRNGTQD